MDRRARCLGSSMSEHSGAHVIFATLLFRCSSWGSPRSAADYWRRLRVFRSVWYAGIHGCVIVSQHGAQLLALQCTGTPSQLHPRSVTFPHTCTHTTTRLTTACTSTEHAALSSLPFAANVRWRPSERGASSALGCALGQRFPCRWRPTVPGAS